MIAGAGRREAAARLAAAERDVRPIEPLTTTWPELEVADAYRIQRLQIRDKLAAGAVVRGHKVGLSSRAMQRMMGVDEPDYGHLLDTMFLPEGDRLRAADFCAPRVEPEVAFVLAEPLPAPGCTVADVLRSTACVLPALEVIDSRVRDWQIQLADTIADNASSARVVLGGRGVPVDALDLRTLGAVLRRNGTIEATGAAGAVLGNPATAVAWLADKLHGFGVVLEAGHVVLPGSCTRAIDVGPGDTVRADFEVLGHVSVTFT